MSLGNCQVGVRSVASVGSDVRRRCGPRDAADRQRPPISCTGATDSADIGHGNTADDQRGAAECDRRAEEGCAGWPPPAHRPVPGDHDDRRQELDHWRHADLKMGQ
ncbi:hypothetical protein [Nocardia sp. CA-119907]|uniref:hypothetical protein n=1 Tax=Nocardia sp. CA-119907 TaxID=3239973 RepID=UPI003D9692B2